MARRVHVERRGRALGAWGLAGVMVGGVLVALLTAIPPAGAATTVITVVGTGDTASPSICSPISTCATLRDAVTTANSLTSSSANPVEIDLPAGTITLTGGVMTIGSSTNLFSTVKGHTAGSPNGSVIDQTTSNGVFLTPGTLANQVFNLTDLTIENAHAGGFGGGALQGGAASLSATGQATTVTDCAFLNNTATKGGAIVFASGGNLTITNSSFTGNSATVGTGGAIDFFTDGSHGAANLTISGSTFTNNSITGAINGGAEGGGVFYSGGGSSIGRLNITTSVFSGNSAGSSTGSAGRGAGLLVSDNNTTPTNDTVTLSTFVNNAAHDGASGNTIPQGEGGGVWANTADLTLSDSRLVGNTATRGPSLWQDTSGTNDATTATDDWWGVNTGPGANAATGGAATSLTTSPWLQLRNLASPATVLPGGSSTFAADLLGLNTGGALAAGSLNGLATFPTPTGIFSTAVDVTVGTASGQFVNGVATAGVTAGFTLGSPAGHLNVTVDSQTVTGNLNIKANSTTAVASGPTPSVFGQPVTFTATLTSNTSGTTPAIPQGGTVQFFVDGVSHGAAAPVSSGNARAAFGDLAVGNHTVTATYSGDADFNGSTTTIGASQIVHKADTSAALASSLNPSFATQPVTFTVTLTAVAPGAGTPGGTDSVQFQDNGTNLGAALTPVNGVATLSTSTLAVGTHTITAIYAGNANFNASTGTLSAGQVVNPAPTSVNVVSSVNPSVFGQPVTFTAQVNAALAGTPAGFVQFGINGVNFGTTETLVAGSAVTPPISNLPVGSVAVTATYTPTDGLHAGSSGLFTQTVNKASTMTIISSSANPQTAGNNISFTATVTAVSPGAGVPTGQVIFHVAGGVFPVTLNGNGVAVQSGISLNKGTYSVVAAYQGDSDFATSNSAPLTEVVNGFPTTTTLNSSANPSVSGQPVTFTATVGPNGEGIPTGDVQFGVDGANVGSPVALSGGVAQLPAISILSVGTHTVTATYTATGNFADSSGTLAGGQTVNQAATAVALGSSANPSALGQGVAFTATVTAVAPGGGTPPGQVTFFVDGSSFGTATLTGGVGTSAPDTTLAVGSHTVTATYDGGTNFTSSTSGTLTQVVNPATASMVLGSSVNPSVFGQPAQFSVTVTGASGTPTGSVQFGVNGVNLGSPAILTGGKATSIADGSLPVGTSTVTATYSGNATYSPATGTLAGGQVVNQANTTTTIGSSANPATAGTPINFTATVTVGAPGAGTPTGEVDFVIDGTTTVTETLNASGVATLPNDTSLSVGSHSVVAHYQGDGNFNSSTSTTLTQVVTGLATTTTLSSSANPSVSGQPVSFTATVSAGPNGTPSGSVQFGIDGANFGTPVTLNGGTANSAAISTLPVGTHTVTATYTATGGFAGSSGTLAGGQTVNKAASSVAVTSMINPSTFGQAVSFTATVSPVAPGAGTPTGQVNFFVDGSALGSASLSGGTASSAVDTSLSVGTHTVTATYTGDSHFTGSTSPSFTQVVGQISATFGLTSTVASPVFGQPVQFTATLSGAAGPPTGSIQFGVNGVNLGSPVVLSGGTATSVADTSLAVGNSTITATYTGDTTYLPGSQSLTQGVNRADTTTTIGSSANPAAAGTPIDFAATVTAVAPGAGTPTGLVQFFADGSTLGSPAGLNAAGVASLSGISSLSIGSHTVTATYLGDTNFNASTSASLAQMVTGLSTTTTVASSANPSVFSQPVSFTATVSAGSNGTPAGSVQFGIDGANIGSPVSLSGGIAQSPPVPTLAVGTHTVTATYSGAPTFVPSSGTLAGGQVVIPDGTTTTLTSSTNPSLPGQPVTFTATVAPLAPGAGTPAGQVLFEFNGGTLGLVNLVNGVAVSPPTANLSPGNYDVTATYQGSSGYTASSGTLTQVVSPLSTTTTLSSSDNGSGPVGSPVTLTATVSAGVGQPAPSGTVAFFANGAPITGCGTQALNVSTPDTATCSTIHQLPVGPSTVTATYSGSPTTLPSTSPPFTEITSATTSITGSHRGSFVVKAGQTLFIGPGATIMGSITVQAGGALDVEGASLHGSISATNAVQIRICGSSLGGGATITGTSGLVVVGDDEGTPSCAGNTITGAVSITNGTGGVEFDFNTVSGSVTITGNTGTVPPPDTGTVVAVGNTIGGGSQIQ